MKPILYILLFAVTSCSTPDQELLSKPNQSITKPTQLAVGCGTINTVQTLFTGGSPSVFIGVRYDLVLDVPQGGFTKAYFILNDPLNTNVTNQFTNMEYVCRTDLTLY